MCKNWHVDFDAVWKKFLFTLFENFNPNLFFLSNYVLRTLMIKGLKIEWYDYTKLYIYMKLCIFTLTSGKRLVFGQVYLGQVYLGILAESVL